jgi:sulfonate transport system permease protein
VSEPLAGSTRGGSSIGRIKSVANGAWRALVLPLCIIALWGAVTEGGFVPKYLLPSPLDVVISAAQFIFGSGGGPYSGTFLTHFWASLQRVLAGFLLGSGIGIPLGIILGYYRGTAAFVEPTLQLTRSIPGICWLPLALIWFGIGTPAAIFLIALGSFYAVFLSTLQAVKYVDPVLLRAARCLGASPAALLRTIVLPATFPSVLSGLRLGLAYSWIYMVLGEFTGVNRGLGATLLQARETLNPDIVISLMIIIGFLGVLSDWPMLQLMRKVFRMDVR